MAGLEANISLLIWDAGDYELQNSVYLIKKWP